MERRNVLLALLALLLFPLALLAQIPRGNRPARVVVHRIGFGGWVRIGFHEIRKGDRLAIQDHPGDPSVLIGNAVDDAFHGPRGWEVVLEDVEEVAP